MRRLAYALSVLTGLGMASAPLPAQPADPRVIVVTVDGYRWQEFFGGAQREYFKRDKSGSVQMLGEDRIEHTPKDERISLVVGRSFDVVAERKRLVETRLRFKRLTDQEVEAFAALTERYPVHVRFIELMPFGSGECAQVARDNYVSNDEVRARIEATCQELAPLGEVHAFTADVSLAADCDAIIAEAVARLGGIDVLVCNAGIAIFGKVAQQPAAPQVVGGEQCDDGELGVQPASGESVTQIQPETEGESQYRTGRHDAAIELALHDLEAFAALLVTGHGVVDEQARQIEHGRHPGDDGSDRATQQPESRAGVETGDLEDEQHVRREGGEERDHECSARRGHSLRQHRRRRCRPSPRRRRVR